MHITAIKHHNKRNRCWVLQELLLEKAYPHSSSILLKLSILFKLWGELKAFKSLRTQCLFIYLLDSSNRIYSTLFSLIKTLHLLEMEKSIPNGVIYIIPALQSGYCIQIKVKQWNNAWRRMLGNKKCICVWLIQDHDYYCI